MNAKKITWLGGWGISPEHLSENAYQHAPLCQHEIIIPSHDWQAKIEASSSEVLIAYSTGSLLILNTPSLWNSYNHIILLAPVIDFRAEANKGSKVSLRQLKVLKRWLQRDPLAALADFYQKAELHIPPPKVLPYPMKALEWGIDQLMTLQASTNKLPMNIATRIGENDSLLSAEVIEDQLPQVTLIKNANHDIKTLLKGLIL